MTLMELKQHIDKSDNLSGIYVFTGNETVILNIYIKNIAKKSNISIMEYDTVKQVYDKLSSNSLFDKNNYVYLVRDDSSFLTAEKDWELFTKKLIKNNVVILTYTSVTKGSKFYKHFSERITVFDYLGEDILAKYVIKELPGFKTDNAKELVNICEKSYSRILLECDKLRHLNKVRQDNINTTYEYAMQNSFIFIPPEDAIFSFVDSCLNRNVGDCYYYLEECKRISESELNILSNLYTKFRTLLQVQSLGYNKDICNTTGLQYYQVQQVSNYTNRYSTDELLRALRLIHYCELSIKQGTMEAKDTIDYMLVNLL